jgi:hypothetical protein
MLLAGYNPDACDAEEVMREGYRPHRKGGRRVRHRLEPGDTVGDVRVLAVLPRRPPNSHERVRTRCLFCGYEAERYAANIWARQGQCQSRVRGPGHRPHCPGTRP